MNDFPEIQITRLSPEEEPPLALLLLADPSEAAISKYLPAAAVFVARHQGETIGVYVLSLEHGVAEILNIAVKETCQGKGIGRRLLEDATVKAKELHAEKLLIGTGNSSLGQLHLYQKSGFEITAIRKNFFLDHYPAPIFENGIQCKHMIMLEKQL
ncbi:GNAT family N-acetyltransferase [Chitinophaga sp. Mgbs1]|uniref:GNAT family N-acetyltransferase n=1 Tax=Chitinophaga solisilvae TaxID=1233460 RepID=A0A3S1JBF8_9BACT|nr:GNAT family N-acetyltransferase [Chitinophaga solisilvae]